MTSRDTSSSASSSSRSDEDAVARRILDGVAGLSADIRDHAGELADSTSGVLADADARLEATSDQSLTMVAGMSVGFAMGLLTGGSNRFLVAAALAPAGVIVAKLLERAGGTEQRRAARAR